MAYDVFLFEDLKLFIMRYTKTEEMKYFLTALYFQFSDVLAVPKEWHFIAAVLTQVKNRNISIIVI